LRLSRALAEVEVGAVALAARDDRQGRFRQGQAVGFLGDEIVAWGTPVETLGAVIEQLAEGSEVISCIAGEGAPLGPDEIASLGEHAAPHVEVECLEGGQAHYWWLLAAE
jgi:dihydroxyacetone kinase-like predicted kinase